MALDHLRAGCAQQPASPSEHQRFQTQQSSPEVTQSLFDPTLVTPGLQNAAAGPSSVLEQAPCSRETHATQAHKPPLTIQCNNHILDSYELPCKGKRPLLNPLLCPFAICVCGCLIYIE